MANSKKRCKHCKSYFEAESMIVVPAGTFCTPEHATEWVRTTNGKANGEKVRKAAHREQLKKVRRNPRAEALIVAQELARISRADDDGFCTCVTCGHVGRWNDGFDGGHYIAKGSSSYWMLDPRNIWPQCKPCNGNGMKFDGRESLYTLFMIREFGEEFVIHMQDVKKTTVKRTTNDYDDFIKAAKAEVAKHKKRIGA